MSAYLLDDNHISNILDTLTVKIIIFTIMVFVVQVMFPGFTESFGLSSSAALYGSYWQFLTYIFLHGGIVHITLNMFVLLIFGYQVENALGKRKFLALYLTAGIGSAVLHIVLTGISSTLLIGASGSVFGILTAYAFLFPKNWIFIPPGLPVRGIYAVIILALFEAFSGFFSLQRGIANFGHLGGIVVGVIAMLYLRHAGRRQIKSAEARDFEFIWE